MGVEQRFQQDMGHVAEEARKAGEGGFGTDGDVKWLDLKEPGLYIMRLLPPWSTAGKISKKVFTHWSIPPKNEPRRCPQYTFDGEHGDCHICNAIDEVTALHASLDLGRQQAAAKYCFQVTLHKVPKTVADKYATDDCTVYLVWLTQGVHTWIMKQQNEREIDLSEPRNGYLIGVTRDVKRQKGEDRVTYPTTLEPDKMPRDVEGDEDWWPWVSGQMLDLDVYFQWGDTWAKENEESGNFIRHYYMSKASAPQATRPEPGPATVATPATRKVPQAPPSKPGAPQTPAPPSSRPSPAPPSSKRSEPAADVGEALERTHGDRPECFLAYKNDKQCMRCKFEVECMSDSQV